jgi:hypothetical protein
MHKPSIGTLPMTNYKINININVEERDLRQPQDNDRLFVKGAWPDQARVERDPKIRTWLLPEGYKRAGDIIIDEAAVNPAARYSVIYAALFCYRQAIELYLKQLIRAWGTGTERLDSHDLMGALGKIQVRTEWSLA